MRSVPIQLYKNGKAEPFKPGYWEFGIWEVEPKRLLWGLISDGFPTHMCYGFDYANPWLGIKLRREQFEFEKNSEEFAPGNELWLRYYFDVGAKLYATVDELERCLRELNVEENYKSP